MLSIARGGTPEYGVIFSGFCNFVKALCLYLLMLLFILLWCLLLVIPGIIAAFSYSMAFYILSDNPTVGARKALNRSKTMMTGNKGTLFCLSCALSDKRSSAA